MEVGQVDAGEADEAKADEPEAGGRREINVRALEVQCLEAGDMLIAHPLAPPDDHVAPGDRPVDRLDGGRLAAGLRLGRPRVEKRGPGQRRGPGRAPELARL